MIGGVSHLKPSIDRIESFGTACGLFIKPYESQFVRSLGVSGEAERASTDPLECSHREESQELEVFVGDDEARKRWVEEKVLGAKYL